MYNEHGLAMGLAVDDELNKMLRKRHPGYPVACAALEMILRNWSESEQLEYHGP